MPAPLPGSLLLTRLTLPPAGPRLLPRPELLARAGGPLSGTRLLLLSAPAGFGKTSLLTTWGQALRAAEVGVAWYSLEAGDNDPARFLLTLVTALARALDGVADFGPVLDRCAGAADNVEVATALLNTLAAVQEPCAIVLDDYHTLSAPEVHGLVGFLVAHLPPAVTLALGTRSDPPLQLARLRASQDLVELRATELRFTPVESDAFLCAALGRTLTPEERTDLDAWAEGWPAGLQLLALQLAHRGSSNGRVLATLPRNAQRVVDYLREEVYAGLSSELQQFLLDTAILDRLSPELCDAVTGRDDGERLLTQLGRANLFVAPLDAAGQWLRYHHLFAEFLHTRLQREQPERLAALHARASAWYAGHGDFDKAFRHAIAAEASDEAAALLARSADDLWLCGETETLRAALDRFPQPLAARWPLLALARAWLALHGGRLAEAEALAVAVARRLEAAPAGVADNLPTLQGRLHVIQAVVLANRGEPTAAAERAEAALCVLPADQLLWRTVAAVALGAAATLVGEAVRASAAFDLATTLAAQVGSVPLRLVALRNLALMQLVQGELRAAGATYGELDRLVERHGGAGTYSALQSRAEQAFLRYERNDLLAARACAEAALTGGQQQRNALVTVQGHLALAQIDQAESAAAAALAHAREATQLAEEHAIAHLLPLARSLRARLERVAGNPDAAHAWALGAAGRLTQRPAPPAYLGPWEAGALVEQWLATGRPADALALAEQLLASVTSLGRVGRLIELYVLQARAHAALGHHDAAGQAIECALTLGEPEGYVRSFVDGGEVVAALLTRMKDEGGRMKRYAAQLLTSFVRPSGSGLQPSAFKLQPLAEPLSVREREILVLVARGASNQAIAEALVIAPSTVKVHLHHILGKLEARSRTEAVARARELGLL